MKEIIIIILVLFINIAFGQVKDRKAYLAASTSIGLSTISYNKYRKIKPAINYNLGISMKLGIIGFEWVYGYVSGISYYTSSNFKHVIHSHYNYNRSAFYFIKQFNKNTFKLGFGGIGSKNEYYTYEIYKKDVRIYDSHSQFKYRFFNGDIGIYTGYERKINNRFLINSNIFWTMNSTSNNTFIWSTGIKYIIF